MNNNLKEFDELSNRHIQNKQDYDDQQIRNGCAIANGCGTIFWVVAIILLILFILF